MRRAVVNLVDFDTLSSECAPWVAPQTMAAIVKTESRFNPLAININARAKLERQPSSKEEAVVTAKWLLANNYNIDMGLGQVNSANLGKTKLSVEDAFDPCKNLAAAATILQWNYESASKHIPDKQAALHAAISAYNTGSFTKGFSNGYVQKVVNNAPVKNLVGIEKLETFIAPIALVGAAKPAASSQRPASPPDSVMFNVTREAVDPSLTVYDSNKVDYDIMVYR